MKTENNSRPPEMKDRSNVTKSTWRPPMSGSRRLRRLVRSSTVTRGSCRIFSATCNKGNTANWKGGECTRYCYRKALPSWLPIAGICLWPAALQHLQSASMSTPPKLVLIMKGAKLLWQHQANFS